ncbi:META domain-containing protein [Methanogenium cariaci]|nr:META domain-containing protein [Methanogenium cariaci]
MEQETGYLAALEAAVTYQLSGGEDLTLQTKDGSVSVRFMQAS